MNSSPQVSSVDDSVAMNGKRPLPNASNDSTLHWTFLILSLAAVLLSLMLSSEGEQIVKLPIVDIAIPSLCNFRRITGLDCPGCGLTRCFIHMAHGNLSRAWYFNPVGTFFFVGVAFQIPYRLWQLGRLHRGLPAIQLERLGNFMLILLSAALLIQWIAKLLSPWILMND